MSNRSSLPTEMPPSPVMRLGNLLIITAPSGAGKSTLVSRLREAVAEIAFSVSYTTRPSRTGEVHGREYYFVSTTEFEQMRDQQQFLEWAQVHNNYYGTHRETIQQTLDSGQDIVLDIDVQGAAQIKQLMPQAILIFIMPPSFEVLSARLHKRASDSAEVIAQRLNTARLEVASYREFDYLIINDDLTSATQALIAIAQAERLRPRKVEARINSILASFQANAEGL